jgi:hypothetical protein
MSSTPTSVVYVETETTTVDVTNEITVIETVVEQTEVVVDNLQGPQGNQGPTGPRGVTGPTGPKGDPGATTAPSVFYVHNQAVPSDTWTINHNLGGNPTAVVQDSAGTTCEGNFSYPSINQLVITFSAAFSGVAYVI